MTRRQVCYRNGVLGYACMFNFTLHISTLYVYRYISSLLFSVLTTRGLQDGNPTPDCPLIVIQKEYQQPTPKTVWDGTLPQGPLGSSRNTGSEDGEGRRSTKQ